MCVRGVVQAGILSLLAGFGIAVAQMPQPAPMPVPAAMPTAGTDAAARTAELESR
jgi:hypothetical protein